MRKNEIEILSIVILPDYIYFYLKRAKYILWKMNGRKGYKLTNFFIETLLANVYLDQTFQVLCLKVVPPNLYNSS